MKRVHQILIIIGSILLLTITYFWATSLVGVGANLGYVYYISPYYGNGSVRILDKEDLNNSFLIKYNVTDYNYTFDKGILRRFLRHNRTNGKPMPHPQPPEDYSVPYHIYLKDSYVLDEEPITYFFYFLLLKYPNGSFKVFSLAENPLSQRFTGMDDIDDPNHGKYKAALINRAKDDFQTIWDQVMRIDMNVTDPFVTYYYHG